MSPREVDATTVVDFYALTAYIDVQLAQSREAANA